MGTINLPGNPHTVSVQKPDMGDFQGLPTHTDMLQEAADTIIRHLAGKLPEEVFKRPGLMNSLKEKLYSFIGGHFQEMFSRYTAWDDGDEAAVFIRYTPAEIAHLLKSMGGAGQFNTGEIERSADSMNTLEIHANKMLRQKTGAPVRSEPSYAVAQCVFRDNALKPAAVTDLKLAINVFDSELIDSVFHFHAAAKYLVKSHICRYVIDSIDRELNVQDNEEFEERSAKVFAESISAAFNPSGVRETVKKSADFENIRTRGFNAAVNSLASILDAAQMGYQFFENRKDGREFVIREYEDTDEANLPDERYQIRLKYFDREQLIEERKAYDAQIKSFENEVQHLWDLIEVAYQDSKSVFKVNDFEDLAKKNRSRIKYLIKDKADEPPYEIAQPVLELRIKLAKMHERIKNISESLNSVERRVMEERLDWLEEEKIRLDHLINPYSLQSGLLIDIDITSIKRKKTTLDSMTGVLNEFLRCLPGGFQEAASAVFGTRHPDGRQNDGPVPAVRTVKGRKRAKAKTTVPAKGSRRR